MKRNRNLAILALFMGWLAGQNVGIGTTTPLTRLHVAAGDLFLGEASGGTGFVFHSRAGNGYDFLQITSRASGTWEWGKGITFVRSSGHVGIGTTNPTERLHIEGNLRLQGAFMPGNNAGMSGQILRSAGAGVPPYWASVGGIIAGHYAYNSTGNVCVNTATWTTHPGVSTTLSLQAGDIVYAWAQGGYMLDDDCDGVSNAGYVHIDTRIAVNGNDFPDGAWVRLSVDYSTASWALFNSFCITGRYVVTNNGNYTFALQSRRAGGGSGDNAIGAGDNTSALQSTMIIIVIRP